MWKCCYSLMFPKTVCLSLVGIVVSLTLILTDVLDVDRVMAFNKPDSQSGIKMKTNGNIGTVESKSTPEVPIVMREFSIEVDSRENVIMEDAPLITKRSIDPTKEVMPKPYENLPSKENDNEQSKESATKDEYDPSKEVNIFLNQYDPSKEVNSSKSIDLQSIESMGTENLKLQSNERIMEKYNASIQDPLISLSNNESLGERNISLSKSINPNTFYQNKNNDSDNIHLAKGPTTESSQNISQIKPNTNSTSSNISKVAAGGISFKKSLLSSFQYEDEDKVDISEFDTPINEKNGNTSPNHESPSDGSMDSETGVVVIDYFLEDSSSQNHTSQLKKENEPIFNTFSPNSTIKSITVSSGPLGISKDKVVLSPGRSKREIKHKHHKRKRNNSSRKFKKLRKFKKPFVTQRERTRKAKNKLQKKIDKFIEVQGLVGENQTRFLERLIAKIDNLTKYQLWNSTRKFKNFSPSDKKVNSAKSKATNNFVESEIMHFTKKVSNHQGADSELQSKNATSNSSSIVENVLINSPKSGHLRRDQSKHETKKKDKKKTEVLKNNLIQNDVLKFEPLPNNTNQTTSEILLSSSKSEENDIETHLVIAPTDTREAEDNLKKTSLAPIYKGETENNLMKFSYTTANSTHPDTTTSKTERTAVPLTVMTTETTIVSTETTTTINNIHEPDQTPNYIGSTNTITNEIDSVDNSIQNSLPMGYMNPLYDRLIDSNHNGKVMVMLWDQNLGKGQINSNTKTFMERPIRTEDKPLYSEPIEPTEEEPDEEMDENKQNDHNIYKRDAKSTDSTSVMKKSVSWIQVNSNVSGFSGKKTDHKKNLETNNAKKSSNTSRKFFKRIEVKNNAKNLTNKNIHKVKKVSGFKNEIKKVRNKRHIGFPTLNENNENLFFSEEVTVSNPSHVDKNVIMNRPVRKSDFDVEGDPYIVSRTSYNPYNLNGDIRQSHFYTTLVRPRNHNKVRTPSESYVFKKLYQQPFEPDLDTYFNRPDPEKDMTDNFYNPDQDQTFDYIHKHPDGNSLNNTTDSNMKPNDYNHSFVAIDSNITAQCENHKSSSDGHILVQGYFDKNNPSIGDLQITVKFKPCKNSSSLDLMELKTSPNKTIEKDDLEYLISKQSALKNLTQQTLKNTNFIHPLFDMLKVSPMASYQEITKQNGADTKQGNIYNLPIYNTFNSLSLSTSKPIDVTTKLPFITKATIYSFDSHKTTLEHRNQRPVTKTKDYDEVHKLSQYDHTGVFHTSMPSTNNSNEKRGKVRNITAQNKQLKPTESNAKTEGISEWLNKTEDDVKFKTMTGKINENNSILKLLLLLMTEITQNYLNEKVFSLSNREKSKIGYDRYKTRDHLQRYFPVQFNNEKGKEKARKYFYDIKYSDSSLFNPETLKTTNVNEDLQRTVFNGATHPASNAINAFTNILYNKYVQSNVSDYNLKDQNNRRTSFEIINIIPKLNNHIPKAFNNSQLKIGTFIKIEEKIIDSKNVKDVINYTHHDRDSNPIFVNDTLTTTDKNDSGEIRNPDANEGSSSTIIPYSKPISSDNLNVTNLTLSFDNNSTLAKTNISDEKSIAVNETQTTGRGVFPIIRKQEYIRADEAAWDYSSPDINVSGMTTFQNKRNGSSETQAIERDALSLFSEPVGFNLTIQEKTDTLLHALEKSLNASREVSNEVSDNLTSNNLNPLNIRNNTAIVI